MSSDRGIPLTPPPRVPPIRPPAPPAPGPPHRPRRSRLLARVSILVFILAVIAFGLFFWLPRWAETLWGPSGDGPPSPTGGPDLEAGPAGAAPAPPAAGIEPAAGTDPGPSRSLRELRELAYLKQEAEEVRKQAADLRQALEDRSVALWGDDDLGRATARFDDGERLLREERFAEAESAFRETVRILETIDGRSVQVLQAALADGEKALAAGDAIVAAAAFDLALDIAPDHSAAQTGMQRAEVLDEVMSLLESGGDRERQGDLAGAERDYRDAVTIDPLSRRAQESLARVQGRISDDAFARAMSDGLAALDRSDWDAARQAFERAGRIRPGSPPVREGLMQAEEGRKLDSITAYRDRALRFERAEDWHAAAKEYAAVLELDPTIRFAQDGRARSERRADLSDRLDYHISHPDRLSTRTVHDDAADLVDEAASLEPSGPRLQAQIDTLRGLLARMAIPVRVRIRSDRRTEVTVYQVGRLGTFESRELELLPGTYTVVGSRSGYRDVRIELVVEPGIEPEPLMVRCEERI